VVHTRVVGQPRIGGVHSRLQLRIGQVSAHRPEHGAKRGLAIAEHHRLHRCPPRAARLSTHSGETLRPKLVISTFLRGPDMQEAVASTLPRSPVGHHSGAACRVAEVACEQAAGDLDLAVIG
jgi:hypothetical protein